MKNLMIGVLVIAFLGICQWPWIQTVSAAPDIDIWTAAAQGDIGAIKQHVSSGTDLNARESAGGSTPLIVAALYGQTEAARQLIENGANLEARNNFGNAAIHEAVTYCRIETIELLLEQGAAVNAKNSSGLTPLDLVAYPWNQPLEGVYRTVAGLLQIELDIERIKDARPRVDELLRKSGGTISAIAIWDVVSSNFWGATRAIAAGFKHAGDFLAAKQEDTGLWRDAVNRLTDGKGGVQFLLTLLGLVVIFGGGLAARWLFRRTTTDIQRNILNTVKLGKLQFLGQVLSRLLLEALGIGIYMLATFVIFTLFFREGSAGYLFVSIYLLASYFVIVLALGARVIFSPHAASLRLFPMEDRDATFLYNWILGIIFIAVFFAATGGIFGYFGLDPQLSLLMHSSSGIVVILALVIMIWQSRQRVALAICSEDLAACGSTLRTAFARNWHYFAVVYVLVAGGIWTAKALNRENVTFLNLILSIFLIPILIGVDQWVQRLLKIASGEARETIDLSGDEPEKISKPTEAVGKMDLTHYVPLIRRFFRIFLIAFLIFVSLHLWGIDIQIGRMFTRSALSIVLIVLLSFIAWQLFKARIDQKLKEEMPDDEGEAEEGGAGGSRMGTLLVLLRKFVLAVMVVIVTLIILASLGVNIGPLIAGAGVIGLAIGFGAQTLVKDIIAGVFFLIDDAFRVGDFIEVGGTKGSVEHISLRSLRLRNPRGPVHTIPFGSMGTVTNNSRDYIISKLDFRVRYDTDVNKVRKIIKKINKKIMKDEEMGPVMLDKLKSQGVRELDDSAMIMRVKFKTIPGEQFVIRREVFRMMQESFREQGIEFAHRNVTVYLPPETGAGENGQVDKKLLEAGAAAAAAAQAEEQQIKGQKTSK
ncbi:Potassium efflux system KefA protein / Small-conductance mechanosensitive channel [Olavius algarvensis Delta 1 endosymbiont]|nr:Potassium efflux system KefA protein / Small-conductance mechanosensitive channel [Olavius algarvensis Delta 1 endosymbiont]